MKPPTNYHAIVAAGGWNLSTAFLSAKAKAQARDSKGRFIPMGGMVRWMTQEGMRWGFVVGKSNDGKTIHVQENGKSVVAKVGPKQLEVVKALIPSSHAEAKQLADAQAWAKKVVDAGGKTSTSPKKVTKAQAAAHLNEELAEQGMGYTADDPTIQELINDELDIAGPDDKTVVIKPPSGSEISLTVPAAKAIVGKETDTPKATIPDAPPAVDIKAEDLAPDDSPHESPLYVDTDGFKKVGGQSGSNQGGVYEGPDGTQYYIKKAQTEQHAANEVLAAKLYQTAGIGVPEVYLTEFEDGSPAVASKIVPDLKPMFPNGQTTPIRLGKAREGFAMDAWLSNWDSVGLVYDNLMMDKDQNPVRVDTGGALIYRAQGSPKGGLFSDTVGETETLRDPGMNPQAAKIFGGITNAELTKQIADTVNKVDLDKAFELIDELPFSSDQVKTDLKAKLQNRKADLNTKFNVPAAPEPEPAAPTPEAPEAKPLKAEDLDYVQTPANEIKSGDIVKQADGYWQAISSPAKQYKGGIAFSALKLNSDGTKSTLPKSHKLTSPTEQKMVAEGGYAKLSGSQPPKQPSKAEISAKLGPQSGDVNPDGTIVTMAMSLNKGDVVKLNNGHLAEVFSKGTSSVGIPFTMLTGPKTGETVWHSYYKANKYNKLDADAADIAKKGGYSPAEHKPQPTASESPGLQKIEDATFQPPSVSFAEELTEDEYDAVDEYTGDSYHAINSYLRGNLPKGMDPQDIETISAHLETAIYKGKSDNDATLFRGIGDGAAFLNEKLAPGTVLEDKAFMSTSSKVSSAKAFGTVFEIDVPSGTPMLDVSKQFGHTGEKEFILPRNSKIEIVEDTVLSDGKRYIRSKLVSGGTSDEVIGDDAPGAPAGAPGAPGLDGGPGHGDAPGQGPAGAPDGLGSGDGEGHSEGEVTGQDSVPEPNPDANVKSDAAALLSLMEDVEGWTPEATLALDRITDGTGTVADWFTVSDAVDETPADIDDDEESWAYELASKWEDLKSGAGIDDDTWIQWSKLPETSPNKSVVQDADAMAVPVPAIPGLVDAVSLDDKEQFGLQYYVQDGASQINGYLRKGKKPNDPSLNSKIQAIDSAIAKSKTANDGVLLRGMTGQTWLPDEPMKPGDQFQDDAFLSTSVSAATAKKFAGWDSDKHAAKAVIVSLDIPKGSNAIDIASLGLSGLQESEYLLPRGSKFEVISDEKDAKGRRLVKARLVPAAAVPSAPGDGDSPAAGLGEAELLTKLEALRAEATSAADKVQSTNLKAGKGGILSKDEIFQSDAAYKKLKELRVQAKPFMDALWAQKKQDVPDLVDPDEARWSGVAKLAKGGLTKVGDLDEATWDKYRDMYVVNDPKTLQHNSSLRSDAPTPASKGWATKVDKLVAQHQLKDDALLYRGGAFSPEFLATLTPGSVLDDKGFQSTGDLNDAHFYGENRVAMKPGTKHAVFEIQVPAGQSVTDVGYGEYVLPRNSKMLIKSVRESDDSGGNTNAPGVVYITAELALNGDLSKVKAHASTGDVPAATSIDEAIAKQQASPSKIETLKWPDAPAPLDTPNKSVKTVSVENFKSGDVLAPYGSKVTAKILETKDNGDGTYDVTYKKNNVEKPQTLHNIYGDDTTTFGTLVQGGNAPEASAGPPTPPPPADKPTPAADEPSHPAAKIGAKVTSKKDGFAGKVVKVNPNSGYSLIQSDDGTKKLWRKWDTLEVQQDEPAPAPELDDPAQDDPVKEQVADLNKKADAFSEALAEFNVPADLAAQHMGELTDALNAIADGSLQSDHWAILKEMADEWVGGDDGSKGWQLGEAWTGLKDAVGVTDEEIDDPSISEKLTHAADGDDFEGGPGTPVEIEQKTAEINKALMDLGKVLPEQGDEVPKDLDLLFDKLVSEGELDSDEWNALANYFDGLQSGQDKETSDLIWNGWKKVQAAAGKTPGMLEPADEMDSPAHVTAVNVLNETLSSEMLDVFGELDPNDSVENKKAWLLEAIEGLADADVKPSGPELEAFQQLADSLGVPMPEQNKMSPAVTNYPASAMAIGDQFLYNGKPVEIALINHGDGGGSTSIYITPVGGGTGKFIYVNGGSTLPVTKKTPKPDLPVKTTAGLKVGDKVKTVNGQEWLITGLTDNSGGYMISYENENGHDLTNWFPNDSQWDIISEAPDAPESDDDVSLLPKKPATEVNVGDEITIGEPDYYATGKVIDKSINTAGNVVLLLESPGNPPAEYIAVPHEQATIHKTGLGDMGDLEGTEFVELPDLEPGDLLYNEDSEPLGTVHDYEYNDDSGDYDIMYWDANGEEKTLPGVGYGSMWMVKKGAGAIPGQDAPAAPTGPQTLPAKDLKAGDQILDVDGDTGQIVSVEALPNGKLKIVYQVDDYGDQDFTMNVDPSNTGYFKKTGEADTPAVKKTGVANVLDFKPGDKAKSIGGTEHYTINSVTTKPNGQVVVNYTSKEHGTTFNDTFEANTHAFHWDEDAPLDVTPHASTAQHKVGDTPPAGEYKPGMILQTGIGGNKYKVNSVAPFTATGSGEKKVTLNLTDVASGEVFPYHTLSASFTNWKLIELPETSPSAPAVSTKKVGDEVQPADMVPGMVVKQGPNKYKINKIEKKGIHSWTVDLTNTGTGLNFPDHEFFGTLHGWVVAELSGEESDKTPAFPPLDQKPVSTPSSEIAPGDIIWQGAGAFPLGKILSKKSETNGHVVWNVEGLNTWSGNKTWTMYHGDYQVAKGGGSSVPATAPESPAEPAKPEVPTGTLVAGSSHVFQDAKGRYVVNKQGHVLREGDKVVTKKGETGTISKFELDAKYAKVKMSDGKTKARQIDTLSPATPAGTPAAPADVAPSAVHKGGPAVLPPGTSWKQIDTVKSPDLKPGQVVGNDKKTLEYTKPSTKVEGKQEIKFVEDAEPLTVSKNLEQWQVWEPAVPGKVGKKKPEQFQPGQVIELPDGTKHEFEALSEFGDEPNTVEIKFKGTGWVSLSENQLYDVWENGTPTASAAGDAAPDEPAPLTNDPQDYTFPEGGTVSVPPGATIHKPMWWSHGKPIMVDGFLNAWEVDPNSGETKTIGNHYIHQLGADTGMFVNENAPAVEPNLTAILPDADKAKLISQIDDYLVNGEDNSWYGYKTNFGALKTFLETDPEAWDGFDDQEWASVQSALQTSTSTIGGWENTAQWTALGPEILKARKKYTGSYPNEWAGPNYGGGQYFYNQNERKALAALALTSNASDFVTSKHTHPSANTDAAAEVYATVTDASNAAVIDELFGKGTSAAIAQKTRGVNFKPALSGNSSPYAKPAPDLPKTDGKNGSVIYLGDNVIAQDGQGGQVVLVTPDGKVRVRRSDGTHFTRKGSAFAVTSSPVLANKPATAGQKAEAAPITLKPRPELKIPDWSKGNVGGLAGLPEALEKVKSSPDAGTEGWSFAAGGSQVEEMNVRVKRVLSVQGQELLELEFKLTPAQGRMMYKRLSVDDANWKDTQLQIEKREWTAPGKLPRLTSAFSHKTHGGRTLSLDKSDGTAYRLHQAASKKMDKHGNGNNGTAFHNLVQIRLPANATSADIAKAMHDVGVDNPGPATKADFRRLAENKLLSLFAKKTDAWVGNDSVKEPNRSKLLSEVQAKWDVTADDIEVVHGVNGRIELLLPQKVADKIVKTNNAEYFLHSLYGGESDLYTKIGKNPFKALTSSSQRRLDGIGGEQGSGASPGADVGTGGADYMFTRPRQTMGGQFANQVVFSGRRMARRMDYFSRIGDEYGARKLIMDIIAETNPNAGETMFKQRMALDDAMGFFVNGVSHRQELINKLHSHGITHLGSRTVEEFIVVAGANPTVVEVPPVPGVVIGDMTDVPAAGGPIA